MGLMFFQIYVHGKILQKIAGFLHLLDIYMQVVLEKLLRSARPPALPDLGYGVTVQICYFHGAAPFYTRFSGFGATLFNIFNIDANVFHILNIS